MQSLTKQWEKILVPMRKCSVNDQSNSREEEKQMCNQVEENLFLLTAGFFINK